MATTDVLTEAEALAALPGITGGSRDGEILMYNSAVSARLDQLCGYIVARDVVEVHDGGSSTLLLNDRPHDYTTGDDPVVEHDAVASISVRVGTVSTAVNLDHVEVHTGTGDRGVVDYVTGLGGFLSGLRSVTVTYKAGRFDTTEDVDPIFKLAARLWLQAIWRPAEGGGSETFGPDGALLAVAPDDVLGILGTEVKAGVIA